MSKEVSPLKTKSKLKKGMKPFLCALLFIGALVCLTMGKTQAYIMPAEQLADLMIKNFSGFKTIVVTQATHFVTPEDLETQMILEEKIWLKSDGFHHSELINLPEDWEAMATGLTSGRPSTDMAFRRLFMANDKRTIMALFSEMGINLDAIAFTRFDGVIVYRLGDKDAEAPKLLIEKENFRPLLLSYRLLKEPGLKSVTVRFDDYREVAGGWYPYKIEIFTGENLEECYFAMDLQVNTPIDSSIFRRHEKQNH
jgi:hypothetical protein